jgi:hypothetical protein
VKQFLRASPTGAVYRVCAKKDASLARERLMVLQQGLQTGTLKQSAWQNAISCTIYPALERARGKHTTRTRAPTTIHFLEPKNLELLLEMNMASRAKSRSSAPQNVFTAPKFRATVGDAFNLANIDSCHLTFSLSQSTGNVLVVNRF